MNKGLSKHDSILIHYTLIPRLTPLLKVSILYVFLIYLGSMSVITMKSNLNFQGLLHRGDRKFASAKSSVTDSSSRNFQYLTKKSRQQNYLAILTRKESTVVNNQTTNKNCDSLFSKLNLFYKTSGKILYPYAYA